jgi:hypothetical protein
MIKRECGQWLIEVEAASPSVVVSARDESGRDLLDVKVTIDGGPAALDGKVIRLDPGRHTIRFERANAAPKEEVVLLTEGEKARPVSVTFATEVTQKETRSTSSIPVASYVLGGLGIVGLGVGSYFGIRGVSDRTGFGCDRGCTDADYSRVNREFLVADVALAVGIASLAAAVAFWFTERQTGARRERSAYGPMRANRSAPLE